MRDLVNQLNKCICMTDALNPMQKIIVRVEVIDYLNDVYNDDSSEVNMRNEIERLIGWWFDNDLYLHFLHYRKWPR